MTLHDEQETSLYPFTELTDDNYKHIESLNDAFMEGYCVLFNVCRCDACGLIGARYNDLGHGEYEHHIISIYWDDYYRDFFKGPGKTRSFRPLDDRLTFCVSCYEKVKNNFQPLLDAAMLVRQTNKLKGVINEKRKRDKDNRTPKVCTGRCCTSCNQR